MMAEKHSVAKNVPITAPMMLPAPKPPAPSIPSNWVELFKICTAPIFNLFHEICLYK